MAWPHHDGQNIIRIFACMKTFKPEAWLPTTKKEVETRGWDYIDVILFSGDAYVDHPSFGAAVIGRTLEAMGLRVAIVPQPDWRGDYRGLQETGSTPPLLRCLSGSDGFDDQPLYRQQTPAQR